MRNVLAMLTLIALTACAVGPDYKRPDIDLPGSKFASTQLSQAQQKALAYWWTRYDDPTLNKLIDQALDSNLRIALQYQRVRQARANLGYNNANLYPTVRGQAQAARERSLSSSSSSSGLSSSGGASSSNSSVSSSGGGGSSSSSGGLSGGGPSIASIFSVSGILNYELDVFGGLRRADQQARAQLLSSAFTQDSIRLTVVSDVVTDYFSLRALQREIRVTQRTIMTRKKGVKLDKSRYKYGAIDKLTLLQTQSLLESARAQLPPLQEQASMLQTSLAILTGKTPRQIMANTKIPATGFKHVMLPKDLPPVLPSLLIERRPDIRAAEASLIAANANVGVAKANFFPQFNLSAMVGAEEVHVDALDKFIGPFRTSSVAGSITSPILDFGRLNALYNSALAQKKQAEIQYRQTVRQAFQDVQNALTEIKYTRQQVAADRRRVDDYRQTLNLAKLRFKVGRTNYFNVLDAQRNLFSSQLNLSTAIRDRFTATADLYKALGGGWTQNSDSITPAMQATADKYDPTKQRGKGAHSKAGDQDMAK